MTAAIETLLSHWTIRDLAQAPMWAAGHRLRYEPPSMPVRSSTQRTSKGVWAARRTEHLKNWSGTQPLALLHAADGSERFAVTVRGQWLCCRPGELQIQRVAGPRNQHYRQWPAPRRFLHWLPLASDPDSPPPVAAVTSRDDDPMSFG